MAHSIASSLNDVFFAPLTGMVAEAHNTRRCSVLTDEEYPSVRGPHRQVIKGVIVCVDEHGDDGGGGRGEEEGSAGACAHAG